MRILRGLGSRLLRCGCQVGIYETYDGHSIAIIDVPASPCGDPGHRRNAVLELGAQGPSDHATPTDEREPE